MMTLDRLNRLYAARCIRRCSGDLETAAKLLGISCATLYRWFPKGGETNLLTKQQQQATRQLQSAQITYLLAYGWEQKDGRWTHRKLPEVPPCTINDALVYTRSAPSLGWP